uniref:Acyl-coenzyme A thioesterase 1-like n=1 Tax=Callorhinchus milii TaxID=7868 RepID=A0A4W3I821_CALMI|eukprot:gi/632942251/ref/XP_007886310.1/ PREDICTED: acyl-coenzyme A thioesterase 1-like [Callorhinchus milii]
MYLCRRPGGRAAAAAAALSLLSGRCRSAAPRGQRAGRAVTVHLLPSAKCLFDDPLQIRADGLSPLQQVTMKGSLTDEKGETFESFAYYEADERGELDLSRSPSLGGHYSGIEPMGLFWSLIPRTPFTRLVKRDVANSPLCVDIEVFDGHRSREQQLDQSLAKGTNERWFMREGVKRIPVREGNIRGTLFVPPGNGPFPGVIDIYALQSSLSEQRACLLANRGFTTLALAYFGHDDHPKVVTNLYLEYFKEAVTFLRQHPKVKGPGIGAIGTSKGGDLVMSIATFLPHVAAVININGCNASALFGMCYKNKLVLTGMGINARKLQIIDSGIADIYEVMNNPMDKANHSSIIPIEKAEGHFLFVVGEDDRNWKSKLYMEEAIKRLREHGKDNYELISYPGAGHFLDPPFFPFCYASYHAVVDSAVLWGGNTKAHSFAQEDLWTKVQAFLHKMLNKQQFKE